MNKFLIILLIVNLILLIVFTGTALAISFDGENLNLREYTILKLELKTKVANRNIQPLQYQDVGLWIKMVNRNLKGCRLENVTRENLIDKLNTCLD